MGMFDLGMGRKTEEEKTRRATQKTRLDEVTKDFDIVPSSAADGSRELINSGNEKEESDEAYYARKDAVCRTELGKSARWDEELGDCSVGSP